jgi:hypothetical protein
MGGKDLPDETAETVDESFDLISVHMLSIAPRAVIRASFSSAEMAVAGPVSTGAIVKVVSFILVAMVVRWFLIAGTATDETFENAIDTAILSARLWIRRI